MSHVIASMTLGEVQKDAELESLVGTETFDDTVDAAHVAIVIEGTVEVESGEIDAAIQKLADRLREANYSAA